MYANSESKLLDVVKPHGSGGTASSTPDVTVRHQQEIGWISPDFEPYWSPPWMASDMEEVERTNSSLSKGSDVDIRSHTPLSDSKSSIDTCQQQHDDVRRLPPPPSFEEPVMEPAPFRCHRASIEQVDTKKKKHQRWGETKLATENAFQRDNVELKREEKDVELGLSTTGNSDLDPPPGMRYKWETYHTEGFLKSREDCSNAHSKLTAITGALGTRITRLSKLHSNGSVKATEYYWESAADRKGFLSTSIWAMLLVIVIPTSINFLLACLPLYELKTPLGTEGFVPLAKNWGWLIHNYIELLFVDLVFMCIQTLYLSSTDHLYFPMWPTFIKVSLAAIAQDLIPRFFEAYPVRFLALFTTIVLGVSVAIYHSWSFVTHELPKFERGRHRPSIVESFFSFGLSSVEKKKAWDKKMSNALRQQRHTRENKLSTTNTRVIAPRRRSVSQEEKPSFALFLPDYVVFRRRRFLVLMSSIGLFGASFLCCVCLTPLLRILQDDTVGQCLIVTWFFIAQLMFRGVLNPKLIEVARYGGYFWDGKYWTHLDSLGKQCDPQARSSGVRCLEYYYCVLHGLYLAYAIPEISSFVVLSVVLLCQSLLLLGPTVTWLAFLPRSLSRTSTSSLRTVAPESARGKSSSDLNSKGLRTKSCFGVVYAGRWIKEANEALKAMPEQILCNSIRWTSDFDQERAKLVTVSKPLRKSKARRAMRGTQTYKATKLPTTKIYNPYWQFCRHWARQWLIPFREVTSESDPAAKKRCERNTGKSYATVELPISHDQVQTTYRDVQKPVLADKPLTLISAMMSTSQTLFLTFMGSLFSGVNFLTIFPFLVYGSNSHSFPFEGMCSSQFSLVMLFTTASIVGTLLSLAIAEWIVRRKTGLSIYLLGVSLFSYGHSRMSLIFVSLLCFSSVWRYMVDHSRLLLSVEQDYGLHMSNGLCT